VTSVEAPRVVMITEQDNSKRANRFDEHLQESGQELARRLTLSGTAWVQRQRANYLDPCAQ
jgi:hypothetical protein